MHFLSSYKRILHKFSGLQLARALPARSTITNTADYIAGIYFVIITTFNFLDGHAAYLNRDDKKSCPQHRPGLPFCSTKTCPGGQQGPASCVEVGFRFHTDVMLIPNPRASLQAEKTSVLASNPLGG